MCKGNINLLILFQHVYLLCPVGERAQVCYDFVLHWRPSALYGAHHGKLKHIIIITIIIS
jgi:hypothetical protein